MQFILFLQPRFARKWELNDTQTRSIVKTISWRITGSFATFIISYVISGNFMIASSIAIIQVTVNTLLYYVHERLWNKVSWGKITK
jgi:uncharacterized membrane protein